MFITYILFSQRINKYYIGHTNDLNRRLYEHNIGHTTFTKTGIPWILMYSRAFESKADAYFHEREIKRHKSRVYIEKLIVAAKMPNAETPAESL